MKDQSRLWPRPEVSTEYPYIRISAYSVCRANNHVTYAFGARAHKNGYCIGTGEVVCIRNRCPVLEFVRSTPYYSVRRKLSEFWGHCAPKSPKIP